MSALLLRNSMMVVDANRNVTSGYESDGLGSTTDLTDGSANPTDAYSYDVFGTIRSQSGSSPNYWLFTGEQRDGQPGVPGGVQRLPLDVVISSSNLTGATVANLDDDPDSPDGAWATATTVADTSIRTAFPTPPNDPTPGAGLQEFRVLLRKNASGGNDPTYDIELWETGGGSPLATLVSGATLSSDAGEVVSVTWDASLLGTADGSAVEVWIVGHRSGGSPNSRRTVERAYASSSASNFSARTAARRSAAGRMSSCSSDPSTTAPISRSTRKATRFT